MTQTRLMTACLAVTDAIAQDSSPQAAYRAMDAAVAGLIGHSLFTVLVWSEGGLDVERTYSSRPDAYPVQGRKRMAVTPWGELVLKRQQCFLGPDVESIRWAFPDHALIESLGLGCAFNVPVRLGGEVIGTINVLDRAGAYTSLDQVDLVRCLSAYLIPALLAARR